MSMKKIVLFAGTTEGHRLCECFVQNKWQAEVFVATEYGREILPQAPNLHIHAGRLDMKQIYSQLTQIRPVCVLDATHPYADEVTKNIKEACQTAGFPYMRILRENTDMTENVTGSAKAHIRVADSMREAVDLLNDKPYLEKNILLTTGSKHLPDYTKYTPDTPCAIVYKASWAEQQCIKTTIKELEQKAREAGITKTALVLVGDFLGEQYAFSKLYDPEFQTEYRK